MKNKSKIGILVVLQIVFLCSFSFSQNNQAAQVKVDSTSGAKMDTTLKPTGGSNRGNPNVLDGVYVREHYPARKAIPYAPLREADVMWSKRIWRVIDINEKINLIFKYPMEANPTNDRKSLIDILLDGVLEGTLTAYDASVDDEFTKQMTKQEIEKSIAGHLDSAKIVIPDPPYEKDTVELKGKLKKDDIVNYRIKEDWFFDKQRSVMDVRIIGICPVRLARDESGNLKEGFAPLFWIYFPQARPVFAVNEVFNNHNDAERRTWDDIFFKRMFGSYITKESNVYNRSIRDYKLGMDQVIESDKIHTDMVNMEHDMWEY
jgi:gliding motility associated protien GldN